MYEASNSRILEHLLTDFHKYVKMTRQMSVGAPDRAEQSIEEHRAILDAIKAKDADLAEKLADEHVMKVMENLSHRTDGTSKDRNRRIDNGKD